MTSNARLQEWAIQETTTHTPVHHRVLNLVTRVREVLQTPEWDDATVDELVEAIVTEGERAQEFMAEPHVDTPFVPVRRAMSLSWDGYNNYLQACQKLVEALQTTDAGPCDEAETLLTQGDRLFAEARRIVEETRTRNPLQG